MEDKLSQLIRKKNLLIGLRIQALQRETGLIIKQNCIITALTVSNDCLYVVTGGDDGVICVWSVLNKNKVFELKRHVGCVRTISISHNNQFLASGGYDGNVILWDFPARTIRKIFKIIQNTNSIVYPAIRSSIFSKNSEYFGAIDADENGCIWSTQTHAHIISFENASSFSFAQSFKYIVLVTREKQFKVLKFFTNSIKED